MMSVKQSVEWELAGETEVVGENLPQRHFVHHKFHLARPGIDCSILPQLRYRVLPQCCNEIIFLKNELSTATYSEKY
jgi:hypothetical protein